MQPSPIATLLGTQGPRRSPVGDLERTYYSFTTEFTYATDASGTKCDLPTCGDVSHLGSESEFWIFEVLELCFWHYNKILCPYAC
jgi:hypothetical protein